MARLIIAQWKETGEIEAYTTLTSFIKHNTRLQFNYFSIDYQIGRKKEPYEDEMVIIRRVKLIGKFVKAKRKTKKI